MLFMTLLVAALLAAGATLLWMRPDVLPQGLALAKHAGEMLGMDMPRERAKANVQKFGTSPEELPYDGTELPDAASGVPAALPPAAALASPGNSSGASGAEDNNAAQEKQKPEDKSVGEAGTSPPSAPESSGAVETSETVKADAVQDDAAKSGAGKTEKAAAEPEKADEKAEKKTEEKPAAPKPAAKKKSGSSSISHAIRSKEISRLRRQAEEELEPD